MCGIVAYLGPRNGVPVVLDGLRKLEYRGYDSAGLAISDNHKIEIHRSVGKLLRLEVKIHEKNLSGSPVIGHTRWATHGRPTEANAHPHNYEGVVVVHNGIVENYLALRQQLTAQGHTFSSETDTEVISHLIVCELKAGSGFVEAVRQALLKIRGTYALAILYEKEPEKMIAARQGSPLVMALGDAPGEYFVASDVPALLAWSRDVIFLEDGELAFFDRREMRIVGVERGEQRQKVARRIAWDPIMAEKGGYKHFMLKEIFEQPEAVSNTLLGRLNEERSGVDLTEIGFSEKRWREFKEIKIIACGTSWHAGLVAKYWFESLARIPVEVDIASEFRYREPLVGPQTLALGISQSGETADTLAAMQEAKRRGACLLAVCNVMESSIARLSDGVFYTHAGPEIGVASTKAFTTQLTALFLLVLEMAARRQTLTTDALREQVAALLQLPAALEKVLSRAAELEKMARRYHQVNDYLYLARGLNFPIALEGALKLKEISYIHAEGYPAGEMKHGPIALIDENMPVVVLAPPDRHLEKIISNLQEVAARDGRLLLFSGPDLKLGQDLSGIDHFVLEVVGEELNPMLYVVPLQLLAYYTAVLKGTDVDQPRNLAKSVTVE
ncbi:MAG: glutamine--fructose-6-phosphate transaminase (isomerizing) [Deltaproteobacteria bacterium]|nr:glutamine--fructose-6-phosphate transaminase (isomerizing) [Deltaproteobacteria bacterium]